MKELYNLLPDDLPYHEFRDKFQKLFTVTMPKEFFHKHYGGYKSHCKIKRGNNADY